MKAEKLKYYINAIIRENKHVFFIFTLLHDFITVLQIIGVFLLKLCLQNDKNILKADGFKKKNDRVLWSYLVFKFQFSLIANFFKRFMPEMLCCIFTSVHNDL